MVTRHSIFFTAKRFDTATDSVFADMIERFEYLKLE